MKNNVLLAASLFAAAAAGAQTTPATPAQPATPDSTQKTQPAQAPATTSPTVIADTSVNAAYVSNPEGLKGLKVEDLRPEHSFPVLGSFAASGNSTGNVTITLDSANKGIVWVEGLSQGKFKAIMKKAPAVYKVPAQTTETGKAVAEGTLFYNPSSKEVTIVLGQAFNDADPTAIATNSEGKKTKTKVWVFTGTKADAVQPASGQ